MMSFGEAFTLIQSVMAFIIVTDVFYERIIQNKLLHRINVSLSILRLDQSRLHKLKCSKSMCTQGNDETWGGGKRNMSLTGSAITRPSFILPSLHPTAASDSQEGMEVKT